jgi:hypothetical protein
VFKAPYIPFISIASLLNCRVNISSSVSPCSVAILSVLENVCFSFSIFPHCCPVNPLRSTACSCTVATMEVVWKSLSAQQQRLYHFRSAKLSRFNLSQINEDKPCQLYEALFGKLLKCCQSLALGQGFRFKNELYSMDASTIDLCLSLFPWASFHKAKGRIKLHVAMSHKANCQSSSRLLRPESMR